VLRTQIEEARICYQIERFYAKTIEFFIHSNASLRDNVKLAPIIHESKVIHEISGLVVVSLEGRSAFVHDQAENAPFL
jgi:hypothetical protein